MFRDLIGMPVLRTDGRSVYGHVIIKFSRMGSLPHFLIHGAPQACLARQSSAIIIVIPKIYNTHFTGKDNLWSV